MQDSVSILIPTYNRAKSLQAVLPSYFTASCVKEVIIVNDGSTDNTDEIVRSLIPKSTKTIKLINHPVRLGQQQSRHDAVAAATSKWVLFGEDDVWLDSDYCSKLLSQAVDLCADAIAGRLLTALVPSEFSPDLLFDCRPRLEGSLYDLSDFSSKFDSCTPAPVLVPFLHSIALIRRELFSVVSFDPWYKGNAHREETDFYLSLNSMGYRVYFTPDAHCFHLRGPISASGGQRINRVALEYWHIFNTWHMVAKHWGYLKGRHNYGCAPSIWTFKYFLRRQCAQLSRLISGKYQSTFNGKGVADSD